MNEQFQSEYPISLEVEGKKYRVYPETVMVYVKPDTQRRVFGFWKNVPKKREREIRTLADAKKR